VAKVDLVQVETSDGVRLDGILHQASGATELGIDLVIFHHGVGGNFYRPSMAAALADRFLEFGCSMLRVNNRGHDHLYSSTRGWLGAGFEIVDDCRIDFAAWINFAVSAGYRRIALWGHSLGAVKLVYFLVAAEYSQIKCAIASSPPRFHFDSFVGGVEGASRMNSIAKAELLIGEGRPDELVAFDLGLGRPMLFSARSALDKYGPSDRYDFFRHLSNVTLPLLLTVGSLEDGFSFDALAAKGPQLESEYSNLTFASIEGADHFYLSHTNEIWRLLRDWLARQNMQ
jgi:pimeloyl-ACP methyl ester carboxylesterase